MNQDVHVLFKIVITTSMVVLKSCFKWQALFWVMIRISLSAIVTTMQPHRLGDELVADFAEAAGCHKRAGSVYFDINPHDGLAETHDVDESLKN